MKYRTSTGKSESARTEKEYPSEVIYLNVSLINFKIQYMI